ncbi:lipopolysaccharide biosynthesis protein [Sphingomonas sp. AP4-R1]|uniref:lipopolysaccharide biosynthesis protein n=1 Tax=Sphingomonas sp. AP4-R1 TaxID=2735134 RepID=UPI001493873F|nr:lipopolysaccharide biosynthesis protein [Sphingomonas sp. AP4-R1]QJU57105.1 lipopolysaccharide biosynthesis protein [Sphingomonas sp. AP4-R1]
MSALSIFRSAAQLGINVLLAFFIDPSEYGLVAFSTPFIVLISMLTDLGMSSALVRIEGLERKTVGAAFTLLISLGAAFALVLVVCTPFIAMGVKMPGLPGVLSGMTFGAILSITAIVPRAMLERALDYSKIALTESLAVAVAGVSAVLLAASGAGVWALVSFMIITNALRAILFCFLARNWLSISFEWRRCAGIVTFGGWVLLTNLLTFLARNFDNLLIGTVLGAASIGLYGLSYQFMLIPMIAITWPASGVLLATLSRGGYDGPQAERIILATIGVTATITFPMMICLSLVFPDFANAVLSPKWREISEILPWLAPLGALQSISSYNGTVLLVAGRARAQFVYAVLNTVLTMLACIIGIQWGLMGMVKAVVIVGTIISLWFIGVVVSVSRLHWLNLAKALVPAACSSAAAILVAMLFHSWPPHLPAPYVALAAGLAIAVLAVYALFLGQLKSWGKALASRNSPEPVVA